MNHSCGPARSHEHFQPETCNTEITEINVWLHTNKQRNTFDNTEGSKCYYGEQITKYDWLFT